MADLGKAIAHLFPTSYILEVEQLAYNIKAHDISRKSRSIFAKTII